MQYSAFSIIPGFTWALITALSVTPSGRKIRRDNAPTATTFEKPVQLDVVSTIQTNLSWHVCATGNISSAGVLWQNAHLLRRLLLLLPYLVAPQLNAVGRIHVSAHPLFSVGELASGEGWFSLPP